MIFSENRYLPIESWPEGMLFRIMLEKTVAKDILPVKTMGRTNAMR
jgi:hypothetical protein